MIAGECQMDFQLSEDVIESLHGKNKDSLVKGSLFEHLHRPEAIATSTWRFTVRVNMEPLPPSSTSSSQIL